MRQKQENQIPFVEPQKNPTQSKQSQGTGTTIGGLKLLQSYDDSMAVS